MILVVTLKNLKKMIKIINVSCWDIIQAITNFWVVWFLLDYSFFYAENTAIIKLFNICICYLSPFHEPKRQRLYSPKVRPFILPVRITKTLQKSGFLTSNVTILFRNTKIWRMLFYTYRCQRFFILLSLGFAENLQKFSAFLFSQRLVKV